jgi:hypothetical protein
VLETVDEVMDTERAVLAVRDWLPVELADERVKEPEEAPVDELVEPELTLEDREALAVPLPVALVDGPENVLVRLTEPELDMVELHDAVPEDTLAEILVEMLADVGRLWEALEPEWDTVRLRDAVPEDVLVADEGTLLEALEPGWDTVKLHEALPEDVLAEMVADEGRLWEALEPEAVPLGMPLAEALYEAEGPMADEPPVTVVLPAEALSLGELLVEVLPVADAFPVGEVVFDPMDDTG